MCHDIKVRLTLFSWSSDFCISYAISISSYFLKIMSAYHKTVDPKVLIQFDHEDLVCGQPFVSVYDDFEHHKKDTF